MAYLDYTERLVQTDLAVLGSGGKFYQVNLACAFALAEFINRY